MSERHQAPVRRVERVVKTGGYGTTKYNHVLECGHVEPRKRESVKPYLKCPQCLAKDAVEAQIATLPEIVDEGRPEDVHAAIARITANIAAALGVPHEQISVRTESSSFPPFEERIVSAMVFMHAAALREWM